MRVKKQAAPSSPQLISTAQRGYLYVTAAITGGAIMIVEILGAKMLAPYVGTSHFVWTAQIAITLMALAAGYYVGGQRVDRSPRLGWLYGSILLAALYLCLTVLAVEPLAYWCLRFKLPIGTLLASTLLFFVPLGLLAMVGPFLIRVLTLSLSGVGGNVGRLTALSTLGSFVGTVLIGYLLIPFLPNSITMCLTGLLLMLIAAGYYFFWGKKPGEKVVSLIFIAVALALGYQESRPEQFERLGMVQIHRSNSNFGLLQVFQSTNGPLRSYLNDYLVQNTYDTNAQKSISMFTYMLHLLAQAYTPRIDDVLCIGLGIGIVPMEFANEGARVDVVEINPAVVPLAQKFFGLRPEKMRISIGDGRYFVNQSQKQYDTIILDAFLGESSPSHLMTKEAFGAMRRILKTNGTLVINCFGDFDRGEDFFVASLEKTLTNVFPSVRLHNERNGGNVLFVASPRPDLKMLHEPDFERVHSECRESVKNAFARIIEAIPEHGIVLTDDYNPVEFYDAANRERIRRNLAQSMRRRPRDH